MNADIRQPCGTALLLSCSPPPHIVHGRSCVCARAEDTAEVPETLQCLTGPKALMSSRSGHKNTTLCAFIECKTQEGVQICL